MSWKQVQTSILTQVLLTIAALLLHLGWVAQLWVTEGPKASVWSWFSFRHPVSNWLEPSGHLVILLSNAHLLLLFFHLFTPVHLLIDSSVEGQYITHKLLCHRDNQTQWNNFSLSVHKSFWCIGTYNVYLLKFRCDEYVVSFFHYQERLNMV